MSKNIRYPNGSVGHKFVTYFIEGKYELIYNQIKSQIYEQRIRWDNDSFFEDV
jgi:hypothetical protein